MNIRALTLSAISAAVALVDCPGDRPPTRIILFCMDARATSSKFVGTEGYASSPRNEESTSAFILENVIPTSSSVDSSAPLSLMRFMYARVSGPPPVTTIGWRFFFRKIVVSASAIEANLLTSNGYAKSEPLSFITTFSMISAEPYEAVTFKGYRLVIVIVERPSVEVSKSVQIYRFRRLLKELGEKKGRGTELVSLYIPPSMPPFEVINALREEYSTASNIKSDQTRGNVQAALTKMMQRLKIYQRIPENGLAIFCGALPTNGPGTEDISLHEVAPPKPIRMFLYRCDDHFHLDILKGMLEKGEKIGIISMDTSEAGLGIIDESNYFVIDVLTSGIAGKHRAGGQSARRFERLRESEIHAFFKRIGEHAAKVFLEEKISKLVVSGPGPTKEDFVKGDYLHYQLKKLLIGTVSTSYSGEEGVRETVKRATGLFEKVRLKEEMALINEFLSKVSEGRNVVYGVDSVIRSLEEKRASKVLVLDEINLKVLERACLSCRDVKRDVVREDAYMDMERRMLVERCPLCGESNFKSKVVDFIEFVSDLAYEIGVEVEVLSSKTEEGEMFRSFGGVGAFLKYPVEMNLTA